MEPCAFLPKNYKVGIILKSHSRTLIGDFSATLARLLVKNSNKRTNRSTASFPSHVGGTRHGRAQKSTTLANVSRSEVSFLVQLEICGSVASKHHFHHLHSVYHFHKSGFPTDLKVYKSISLRSVVHHVSREQVCVSSVASSSTQSDSCLGRKQPTR